MAQFFRFLRHPTNSYKATKGIKSTESKALNPTRKSPQLTTFFIHHWTPRARGLAPIMMAV